MAIWSAIGLTFFPKSFIYLRVEVYQCWRSIRIYVHFIAKLISNSGYQVTGFTQVELHPSKLFDTATKSIEYATFFNFS